MMFVGSCVVGNSPEVYQSVTVKQKTACGSIYVTCLKNEEGELVGTLARLGKAGNCVSANVSVIAALITEGLRGGVKPEVLVRCLDGVGCFQSGGGVLSCSDAFAKCIVKATEKSGEQQ